MLENEMVSYRFDGKNNVVENEWSFYMENGCSRIYEIRPGPLKPKIKLFIIYFCIL